MGTCSIHTAGPPTKPGVETVIAGAIKSTDKPIRTVRTKKAVAAACRAADMASSPADKPAITPEVPAEVPEMPAHAGNMAAEGSGGSAYAAKAAVKARDTPAEAAEDAGKATEVPVGEAGAQEDGTGEAMQPKKRGKAVRKPAAAAGTSADSTGKATKAADKPKKTAKQQEAGPIVLSWGGQLDERLETLGAALRERPEAVDFLVQSALLNRALGYDYLEEKTEYGASAAKVTQTRKHQPGDLSAQTFWLKNRCPERWRDKPEPLAGEGQLAALIDGLLYGE